MMDRGLIIAMVQNGSSRITRPGDQVEDGSGRKTSRKEPRGARYGVVTTDCSVERIRYQKNGNEN